MPPNLLLSEISYSDLGLEGRDIFLAEFSEVLFYFEDTDQESFYEKLISVIAPDHRKCKILCLGGKDNVLKVARTKNDLGCPRVFVVDKDFDDILDQVEKRVGLIYLDRFCLENYLISFPAILGFAIDHFALRTFNL